ncbi:hypothetical protein [Latilactobacillus curvatus]|nr:hypothetical protein [Latilactobacillus curvatus]
MFFGIILAVISGVTAIILAVEKLTNAITKLVIAWQNLYKTIKK